MENLSIIILSVILLEVTYLTYVLSKKNIQKRNSSVVFVDTSVLIDGRITDVAKTGFLPSKLLVPRSVIGELQYMADNSDNEKRSRARHGLDVVSELQLILGDKMAIFQDGLGAKDGVDNQLLKLAKEHDAAICTIDYNLNKVAKVEGIPVLNVNDLAMSLRMSYLPGEQTVIELTQKGQDSHQAVGHLGDGTMVVVEHANNLIGKKVKVEFIRSLQTAAGKMMFARIVAEDKNQEFSKPKALSRHKSYKKSFGRQNRNKSDQKEHSFIDLVNKQQ